MQKIAILYDASQAVLSTFDLDEVLQQILVIARDYFHLQNVAILLLDKESGELYVRRQVGWDEGQDKVPGEAGKRNYRSRSPAKAARCMRPTSARIRDTSWRPKPPARNWPSRSWCATRWWASWIARAPTSITLIRKPPTC